MWAFSLLDYKQQDTEISITSEMSNLQAAIYDVMTVLDETYEVVVYFIKEVERSRERWMQDLSCGVG